jgi:hypothetical protein
MNTIDLTPTWAEILPALLLLLSNGTLEGRETAERELERMAALADVGVVTVRERYLAAKAAPGGDYAEVIW